LVLANLTDWLQAGPAWPQFRVALASAGLDSVALSDAFNCGSRLLVTSGG
jgi:hypothetical protein